VQRVSSPQLPIPPHTHPYAETVTVISGSVVSAWAKNFRKKGEWARVGALFAKPGKARSFLFGQR